VTVSWTAVSGASGYEVAYYYGTNSPTFVAASGTSKTISSLTNGTMYYFAVEASNSGSTLSSYITADPGGTVLTAPGPLACRPSNSEIDLYWNGVSGATDYIVYRGLTSSTALYADAVTTGSHFADTSLTNGTTYYYQVAAVSANGVGTECGVHSAVPDSSLLPAPQDVVLQGSGTTETVEWLAVTGATNYYIYRSTSPTEIQPSDPPYDTAGNNASYGDTSITSGTTYYYAVSAMDASGEGNRSSETAVTIGATAIGAPSTTTATAATGQVSLTWSSVSPLHTGDTVTYCVYRDTHSDPLDLAADGLSATSYTDTGLTNGTLYYYRIAAEDNGVRGTPTSNFTATPLAGITPLSISASGQTITLTWTAITGATGYNIYRCTTPGGESGNVLHSDWTGTPTSGYTDSTVAMNVAYYYKVTGVYGVGTSYSGESSLSASAEATFTLSPVISAVTASPSPVTGSTAALAVTASDYTGGPGGLTYTWSTVGSPPATVAFSTNNGTSTGNSVTATFSKAGTYSFQVVVTDSLAGTATGSVGDTVNQTPTILTVSPTTATVASGTQKTFTDSETDQFVNAIASPSVTWSATHGSITSLGVYTAPNSGTTDTVTATDNVVTTVKGTATVSITPGAPSSLTATGYTSTIGLTWTAPLGTVSSYNVYRGTASGAESSSAITTGLTTASYTDSSSTGLINGYTYYYEVAAVNSAGTGGMSNEASAEAGSSTIAAPTSVATIVGDSHVIVWWPQVSGATSYKVYRSTGGSYTLLAEGINTSVPIVYGSSGNSAYGDGNVTNGSAYSYKVSSLNSSGEGSLSSAVSATPTNVSLPAVPQFPAATAGSGQVTTQVNKPAAYLYYGTGSGAEGLVPVANLNIPTGGGMTGALVTGLTNGTTYYFVCTEVATVGSQATESERSVEVTATPGSSLLAAPTLTINTSNNMGPLLSWTSITGAASYNITSGGTRGQKTGTSSVIANIPSSSTSYVDTSEAYGDTDGYTVAAVETAGQGNLSSSIAGMLQGFGIQVAPATVTISPGAGGEISIQTPACQNYTGDTPASFTGNVAMSISGAPSGVSAWFLPSLLTIALGGELPLLDNYSAGANLYISVASTTSPGTYPLTITGTSQAGASQSFTQTQVVTLIVP
jgi:hypothetical protein